MDPLTIIMLAVIVGVIVIAVISRGRGTGQQDAATLQAAQQAALQAAQQAAAQAEHASRVQQIAKWEAAYAELHPGEPIPSMPVQFAPTPTVTEQSGARTNTLAILALIFGLGGGLLGIVFGHAARAQIRRTGESGWGLATVGLVFGYLGLIVLIVLLIAFVVVPFVIATRR